MMAISIPWIIDVFLISIRMATVLLFTPVQAIRQLPVVIRLIIIFAFSIIIINYLPDYTEPFKAGIQEKHTMTQKEIRDDKTLIISGIAELANGLILASSIYAAFAVFQIAGQLIDNTTGLNALAIFNPSEHHQDSFNGQFLSMLGVLFFFNLDGHLWLFKGLAYSFVIIPPGTLILFSTLISVTKQFTFCFTMALMIASPIMAALIAIDLCGALLTRNMPQVNTYFLIIPIKISLGLMMLMSIIHYFNPLTNRIFEYYFHIWQEMMS